MTYSFSLPEPFSAYCLDDSIMAEAYDALGPEKRAVLKKNIAVLHAVWREQRESTILTRRLPEGYTVRQESEPAPYALVVCDAAYPSPACFLAAAMPALLAGVRLVVPCFVGNAAQSPAALASLVAAVELAGLEEALALPDETKLLPLAQALHGRGGAGRLVVLGPSPLARGALIYALDQGIPCLSLARPPHFYPAGAVEEDAAPALSVVSALQAPPAAHAPGQGVPAVDAAHANGNGWPAFSWAEQAGIPTAAPCDLELAEGLATLWVWPGLDPAWFMNRRMRLSTGAPLQH